MAVRLYEASALDGVFEPLCGAPANRHLAACATADGTAIVCGESGTLLVSRDAGHSWSLIATRTHQQLSCCAIDAERRVLVGGPGAAARVSRDSSTFAPIDCDGSGIVRAVAASASGFVALGFDNALLVERDGRFERRAIECEHPLTALCVAADDSVYVAGEKGALLRSNDGGARWTACKAGTKSAITALFAARDGALWIIGPRGLCRRSTDGRSWQPRGPETRRTLVALWAEGSLVVAVDDQQHVFVSHDEGSQWSAVRERTNSPRTIVGFDAQRLLSLGSTIARWTPGSEPVAAIDADRSAHGSVFVARDGTLWLAAGPVASSEDGRTWAVDGRDGAVDGRDGAVDGRASDALGDAWKIAQGPDDSLVIWSRRAVVSRARDGRYQCRFAPASPSIEDVSISSDGALAVTERSTPRCGHTRHDHGHRRRGDPRARARERRLAQVRVGRARRAVDERAARTAARLDGPRGDVRARGLGARAAPWARAALGGARLRDRVRRRRGVDGDLSRVVCAARSRRAVRALEARRRALRVRPQRARVGRAHAVHGGPHAAGLARRRPQLQRAHGRRRMEHRVRRPRARRTVDRGVRRPLSAPDAQSRTVRAALS
jgi:photosystem II stability/assembly factor-like uncharacterized protein